MKASEPKLVNPVLNIIGVNLLRLGGLQITIKMSFGTASSHLCLVDQIMLN